MSDFEAALRDIEGRIGKAPRALDARTRADFVRPVGDGLPKTDQLQELRTTTEILLEHGEVTLARIYMANTGIFEPGDEDLPAGLVFGFDRQFVARPELLEMIGHHLFDFCESQEPPLPVAPWLRRTFDGIYSGYERPFFERVPPILTRGRVAYHSTVMIYRNHLGPKRTLSSMTVPILACRDPELCPHQLLIPVSYWPPRLISLDD